MGEEQSVTAGRDAHLAMLLRHKWRAEIEKAVDKVKLGIVPGRKRRKTDQWFRKQWYRSMMRDRRRKSTADFNQNEWRETDEKGKMVRRPKLK